MSAKRNEGVMDGFLNLLDRMEKTAIIDKYVKHGAETVDLSQSRHLIFKKKHKRRKKKCC